MSSYGFDTINEQTGFAQGERFTSEDQVREYFTHTNIVAMFGPENAINPDVLTAMAAEVIANRWHCDF